MVQEWPRVVQSEVPSGSENRVYGFNSRELDASQTGTQGQRQELKF